uniref:p40 n=1 Tax=Peanut clump virus N TaxID=188886 RepID=Q8B0Y7_9VIRU|nr:P40 [Peanut clump virus N]
MGTFILDDPSLFIVPGRVFREAQGYLRIFRCVDYNSKSNIVGSDFQWVGDIDVLKLPVIYDSLGNVLVKQQVTHDDIFVDPCSCPIKGNDLLRLYQKLRKYHMIVNSAGQVMLALDDKEGKVYADESKKVLVSEYLRCADVFLWSEFGAPADSKLCKLYVRFQLFTDHRVDDLQQELEDCRKKPNSPATVDSKHQKLERQLSDLKKKLADEEAKVKEKVREVTELKSKVKDLEAELADCKKQSVGGGSKSDVEACEARWKKVVADMSESHQRDNDRHWKYRNDLSEKWAACEAEKRKYGQRVNDALATIGQIKAQLLLQYENTTRYNWGTNWFHQWVKGFADGIDVGNGKIN